MNTLSKEQLQKLTDAIIERLLEFELPAGKLPAKGVVRVAYEVICDFQRQQRITLLADKTYAEIEETRSVAKQVATQHVIAKAHEEIEARKRETSALPEKLTLTLGPEHILVTPLRNGEPKEDDNAQFKQLGSEEKAVLLREIIGELQMLSKHGEMLTQAEWDEHKPPHLPKAQAAVARYKITWGRLAEYANLEYQGRRPSPERAS